MEVLEADERRPVSSPFDRMPPPIAPVPPAPPAKVNATSGSAAAHVALPPFVEPPKWSESSAGPTEPELAIVDAELPLVSPIPADVRPISKPPPPLAARAPSQGVGVSRPSDVTQLVHRHGAIFEDTLIEVGPDDAFFGVVDRQVAFALMPGVHKTPEDCEGFFVSRGVEGVELERELGEVSGEAGARGQVRVQGRMAFEVVDPARLLASDAPLDDDALAELVSTAACASILAAIREGLARNDLTLSELADGDADVRVLDRCTSERHGPKLLRSHGIAIEFGALQVRCALSSMAQRIARISEAARAVEKATAPAGEHTMPEPTFVERPDDSSDLVFVHRAPLVAATVITVGEGDTFCGWGKASPFVALPPGRHRIEEPLEGGMFIKQTGEATMFGGALGNMRDFKGAHGSLRAFGRLEVHVEDPIAFLDSLVDPAAFDGEELFESVRAATSEALRTTLESGFGGGEWELSSVSDPSEVDELRRRAKHAYASRRRVPGTAIELLELSVNVAEDMPQSSVDPASRDAEPEPEAVVVAPPPPTQQRFQARESAPIRDTSAPMSEPSTHAAIAAPLVAVAPSGPVAEASPWRAEEEPAWQQQTSAEPTHAHGGWPIAEPPPPPAPPPAPGATPPPPPATDSAYSPGAQVLVLWSDGQRYPGQVHQSGPGGCLVLFPNGHQQWIPNESLVPA